MNTIDLKLKNGKTIEIMYCDLPWVYTFNTALQLSTLIGKDWRLPSKTEIEEIFEKKDIYNFADWGNWAYWTGEEINENTAIIFAGQEGVFLEEKKEAELLIRLVKSK